MAEVKLKEETELWEPRGPCGSWGPAEEHTHSEAVEPAHLKEEPELCIKQEPQEFPFHMVTVKTEEDEDKSSVLHQRPTEENREETNGWDCGAEAGCSSDPLTQFHSDSEEEEHTDSSEDTDHSEDYSQEQAPAKRSYAMIPPDATVSNERPFSCSECGKSFKKKARFREHMFIHSGEKPHKCPECGKRFQWKSRLQAHWVIHSGEKPFSCSECGKKFRWQSNLLEHRCRKSREMPHKCPECGKKLQCISGFERHILVHLREETFSCSDCGKKFRWKPHLQELKLIHSEINPHKCPECGKKFQRKANVKRHMLSHTGEKPHKCSVCETCFREKRTLTRHQRSKHHMCPVCEACFQDDLNLKEHLQTHLEDGTVDQSTLKVYFSSDKKPYSCLECGKSFRWKTYLQEHMIVHSGEKPHNCPECGKRFGRKGDLKRHMWCHAGSTSANGIVISSSPQISIAPVEGFRPSTSCPSPSPAVLITGLGPVCHNSPIIAPALSPTSCNIYSQHRILFISTFTQGPSEPS